MKNVVLRDKTTCVQRSKNDYGEYFYNIPGAKAVNYLCVKTHSKMFDWVLNAPLHTKLSRTNLLNLSDVHNRLFNV